MKWREGSWWRWSREGSEWREGSWCAHLSDPNERPAGRSASRRGRRQRATPTIPPFSGSRGCTQDMTDRSPLDFFQLLVPDDLLQVVVDQTNLFARQYIDATELSRFSRVGKTATRSS